MYQLSVSSQVLWTDIYVIMHFNFSSFFMFNLFLHCLNVFFAMFYYDYIISFLEKKIINKGLCQQIIDLIDFIQYICKTYLQFQKEGL